jgi:hypothetical protein
MIEKKTYSAPQLFRIELNQEQAILSACSLATTSAAQGAASGCMPRSLIILSGCKKSNITLGSDSGPRPS